MAVMVQPGSAVRVEGRGPKFGSQAANPPSTVIAVPVTSWHQAFGIVVLTVSTTGIARIVGFADPGLLGRFGFPPTWR
jgi:hypothetical protein